MQPKGIKLIWVNRQVCIDCNKAECTVCHSEVSPDPNLGLFHKRISRHSLGGAETNVALMNGICLSVFALISIMKILFSYENLQFFALISSQPEC